VEEEGTRWNPAEIKWGEKKSRGLGGNSNENQPIMVEGSRSRSEEGGWVVDRQGEEKK